MGKGTKPVAGFARAMLDDVLLTVTKTASKTKGRTIKPGAHGHLTNSGKVPLGRAESPLVAASSAAYRAADRPDLIFIKNKHLSSFGGRYAKFDSTDIGEVQGWVAEGLKSDRAVFRPNGVEGTFTVEVNLQRSIGTKGQTQVRVIVTDDGRVINALPIKGGN